MPHVALLSPWCFLLGIPTSNKKRSPAIMIGISLATGSGGHRVLKSMACNWHGKKEMFSTHKSRYCEADRRFPLSQDSLALKHTVWHAGMVT